LAAYISPSTVVVALVSMTVSGSPPGPQMISPGTVTKALKTMALASVLLLRMVISAGTPGPTTPKEVPSLISTVSLTPMPSQ